MPFEVDSHFHIFDLKEHVQDWQPPGIARTHLADEYESNIRETPVKYGVFVQCLNKNIDEALWVLNQKTDYIKGVVAGLDLWNQEILRQQLDTLSAYPAFVGCRVYDSNDVDFLSRDNLIRGIHTLEQHDKTFDFMITPNQLKHIPKILASASPNQRFVVDHMGKPYIKDGEMDGWKQDMAEIAKYPNVFCKISGMVTEADWNSWTIDQLRPYAQYILDIFTPDRCMFGSDWPVCTLANSSYKRTYETASELLSHLTPQEREGVFKNNAIKFYKLKI